MSRTITNQECMDEYNKFWKELVEIKGKIDKTLLARELWTYSYILEQVPIVYCEITGGRLSYPDYPASSVLGVYEENNYDKGITQSDVQQILDDKKTTRKEKLKEIREYFEIEDE